MNPSWDIFLPNILTDAPGCPDEVAIQACKAAAAEFCERTLAWREELPAVNVSEGVSEYALVPPQGTEIVMVLSARLENRPLAPLVPAPSELGSGEMESIWWSGASSPTPDRYLLPRHGAIRLAPTPSRAIPGGLIVTAALKPAPSSAACPEVLAAAWLSPICHGAKARLLAMPGWAWSRPELSLHHDRQFRAGTARARSYRLKGHTAASLTVPVSGFGPGFGAGAAFTFA